MTSKASSWYLVPSIHNGDCGFYAMTQLLGWGKYEIEKLLKLRKSCADVVRSYDIHSEQLRALKIRYAAAFEDPSTMHENMWYLPLAPYTEGQWNDRVWTLFRKRLANAISKPGNIFWCDSAMLSIMSDLYQIVIFAVVQTGHVIVVPSTLTNDIGKIYLDRDADISFGFLRNLGETTFDAICYTPFPDSQCGTKLTYDVISRDEELSDFIKVCLTNRAIFPVPIRLLDNVQKEKHNVEGDEYNPIEIEDDGPEVKLMQIHEMIDAYYDHEKAVEMHKLADYLSSKANKDRMRYIDEQHAFLQQLLKLRQSKKKRPLSGVGKERRSRR